MNLKSGFILHCRMFHLGCHRIAVDGTSGGNDSKCGVVNMAASMPPARAAPRDVQCSIVRDSPPLPRWRAVQLADQSVNSLAAMGRPMWKP